MTNIFAPDEKILPKVLTPEEIVIGLIESRGISTQRIEQGQVAPNFIEELQFQFRWNTAAELITQVNSTLDSYLQINKAKCIHIRCLDTYESRNGEHPPLTRAIFAFEF